MMRTLSIVFIGAACLALVLSILSYRTAQIGSFLRFVRAAAQSERDCQLPAVLNSLQASIKSSESKLSDSAMAHLLSSKFNTTEGVHPGSGEFWFSVTMWQRERWLLNLEPESERVAAFCALGHASGRQFNLVKIADIVGLPDITRASPTQLRALTDTYVVDLRFPRLPAAIRRKFGVRVRSGVSL